MAIFAMKFRDAYCYETLVENDIINADCHLGLVKRFMDRWHGNRNHPVWLLYDIVRPVVMPQLLYGLSKSI